MLTPLVATCVAFVLICGGALAGDVPPGFPGKVELTCVDSEATAYATFQSHNQKVIANKHGIFMTHIRARNEPYTAQTWRLSRSTDGGKSFATIFEDTHATNPPVLETDEVGNVYLARPDFQDGNAYLYRFLAEKDFRDPIVTAIPGAAAGKYAMAYDAERKRLYFFAHNNTFHIIGLDGKVLRSRQLLAEGQSAVLQYPLLNLDTDGTLHAAWTTQKHGVYLYWDIHHMLSRDGGETWQNMDGTPLGIPLDADQTGPSLRITLDDEFECHTWLSSFLAKDGKLHFLYLAQSKPQRQHYVRYDIATGKRELDIQPLFSGKDISLSGLDGFFASRAGEPKSPLYCVMQDVGRIACLASSDNGSTWVDYARTEEKFGAYSIGGCREVTDDGYVIGSFTDQKSSPASLVRDSKVYFLKIKTTRVRAQDK